MAKTIEELQKQAMLISGMKKRSGPKKAPAPATKADTEFITETMKQQALKRRRRGAYATKGQKMVNGQLRGVGPIQLADIATRTGAATTVGREQLTRDEFMTSALAAQGKISQSEAAKILGGTIAGQAAAKGLAAPLGSSILRGIGGMGGYLGALGPVASLAGIGLSLYSNYRKRKKEKKQKKQREAAYKKYTQSIKATGGKRRMEGDTGLTGGEII